MIAEVEEARPTARSRRRKSTRAVRKYLAVREQRLTKSTTTATELSEWVGAGDWRLLFIHRDRVAKVTADDVNAWPPRNTSSRAIAPSACSSRLPSPIARRSRRRPTSPSSSRITRGARRSIEGEVFDPTPANIEKRVQAVHAGQRPEGGLLPEEDARRNRRRHAVAPLRQREVAAWQKATAAGFVGSMMMRGTKKHNRQEIQDELDILKSKLALSSSAGVAQRRAGKANARPTASC